MKLQKKKKPVRERFRREARRFDAINRQAGSPPPTERGLRQFHRFESLGETPAQPDPYYEHLVDGKRWWEWTLNSYAELYLTDDWPGWAQLEEDFADDPAGFKQLERRIGRIKEETPCVTA